MNSVNQAKFSEFEEIIGYKFSNTDNLSVALHHTSVGGRKFEFFEFLGDRVLGMCIAELLLQKQGDDIKTNNDLAIKTIARQHAKLVSTDCLVMIAKLWSVEKFFNHNIEFLSNKVFADVTEAIIGAIYLDSNYKNALDIITKWFAQFLTIDSIEPKTKLQELAQSKGLIAVYTTMLVHGKDHSPEYKIQVTIDGLGYASGIGGSKHEASKNAAKNLLKKLNEV